MSDHLKYAQPLSSGRPLEAATRDVLRMPNGRVQLTGTATARLCRENIERCKAQAEDLHLNPYVHVDQPPGGGIGKYGKHKQRCRKRKAS